MSITSYAQNFEDVMLWRALYDVEDGFYVDVGAQHPVVDSVSRAFHDKGWRGIHVEPQPEFAQMLRQARPGDSVVQAVIGDAQGMMEFYNIPDTGLSTTSHSVALDAEARGFPAHRILVPSLTLDDIFASRDGEIHWLKIDIEGGEEAALRGWRGPVRPWVVIIESTLPGGKIASHEEWESLILNKGYIFVWFDGLNRHYLSNLHIDRIDRYSTPPNLFDGFTFSGEATSSFTALLNQRLGRAEAHRLSLSDQIERLGREIEEKLTAALAVHEAERLRTEADSQKMAQAHEAECARLQLALAEARQKCAEMALEMERQKGAAATVTKVPNFMSKPSYPRARSMRLHWVLVKGAASPWSSR